MKHRSLLFLSIALAVNAGAGEPAALTLANTQPMIAEKRPVTATEESRKATTAAGEKAVYIVQLADPAVASYSGGIAGFAATSPRMTGASRLDVNSRESQTYAGFLLNKQESTRRHCEQALGRKLNVKFNYQHAFNGMAMELTRDEAKMVGALPQVVKITKERFEYPTTDAGPQWIGADAIWGNPDYPSYKGQSRGEGMVVAVLDSGVNSSHPSFADIGGDGYDHDNPLGAGNYIPGSYCDTVDPSFCNDKLIGAWGFTRGPQDPNSPEDSDGHGSHTASTAVGNVLKDATLVAPTTSLTRDISGVAPHANLIVYDVCIDSCPGSALLAAVEQVVIDAAALPNGIQALNYSISGGDDPYNDPVELGFLNATEAGIFVSASAGNDGPGASTVAHNSPWVATVAAMTHSRKMVNTLTDLSSDATSLNNISSVGFTSGYGPAPIIYAGDFPTANGSANDSDPAQCLDPFPAGHFNGEIVVCDRGAIARTAKGDNVLAGGAGGFVLANTEAQGEDVSGDSHSLPAVHIGFNDGEVLRTWLATQTNTTATISGAVLTDTPANGDIMAGFSSRGPNLSGDILKPDVGAPGVSIFAAVANDGSGPVDYNFLSGTSMSSPHNAGAAALVSAVRPEWSPYAIKSALMMTAKRRGLYKDDGVTPTDAFDVGAGRIDLNDVQNAGLILNETQANFLAANPATGGDPKTLNIASMQDSNCVGECSWTRTVTSASDRAVSYVVRANGPKGLGLQVRPGYLRLQPGESADITVRADTTLAEAGWNFAELKLRPWGRGPKLHMPIAVNPSNSTDANLFNLSVDKAEAGRGDILTYEVDITNGPISDVITFSNELPRNLKFVPGSITTEISQGETLVPLSHKRGELSWSGTLNEGGLVLTESPAPFGYFSLPDFGIAPFGCPADNCDDGGVILDVPSFTYNGASYNQVIWSVNGTLQAGVEGGTAAPPSAQALPSSAPPNNLLAPFWTDLNMGVDGDGAEWYIAVLNDGAGNQFTVYEWNNIPLFGDDSTRYTFQIWVLNGPSGNIWFVYDTIGAAQPATAGVSVGVENSNGSAGYSYFYAGEGTAPTPGVDLRVDQLVGGTARFTFQAEVKRCGRRSNPTVNRAYLSSGDSAIAVTECQRRGGK